MDEKKEWRLMVVRCCMIFLVLVSWAIFFGYLFLVHRAAGTDFWGLIGSVVIPSLQVLVGAALVCSLVYFIYRTALIKTR
jgi:hypothetical protein